MCVEVFTFEKNRRMSLCFLASSFSSLPLGLEIYLFLAPEAPEYNQISSLFPIWEDARCENHVHVLMFFDLLFWPWAQTKLIN